MADIIYHAAFMFDHDGSCIIRFPSLKKPLLSAGKDFIDAIHMAREALTFYFRDPEAETPTGDTIQDAKKAYEEYAKQFDEEKPHVAFVPVTYHEHYFDEVL